MQNDSSLITYCNGIGIHFHDYRVKWDGLCDDFDFCIINCRIIHIAWFIPMIMELMWNACIDHVDNYMTILNVIYRYSFSRNI